MAFFLVEDLAHERAGDSVRLGDFGQAVSVDAVAQHAGTINLRRAAPDTLALELGAPHAGTYPFDDQVAFEFRHGGNERHQGPAQRAACIQLFPEADELDVVM